MAHDMFFNYDNDVNIIRPQRKRVNDRKELESFTGSRIIKDIKQNEIGVNISRTARTVLYLFVDGFINDVIINEYLTNSVAEFSILDHKFREVYSCGAKIDVDLRTIELEIKPDSFGLDIGNYFINVRLKNESDVTEIASGSSILLYITQ